MKKRKAYKTVGVRFLGQSKVYTYRVPATAKILLGDLLTVRSDYAGMSLVAVVQLEPPVPEGYTLDNLTLVSGKVVML